MTPGTTLLLLLQILLCCHCTTSSSIGIKWGTPTNKSTLCARKGGSQTCTYNPDQNRFQVETNSVTCHLGPSVLRPKFCLEAMMSLLKSVTALLEFAEIPHWITQGTLLGAVRSNALLPWTNDVDISAMHSDFPQILHILQTITLQKNHSLSIEDGLRDRWSGLFFTYNPGGVIKNTGYISISNGITGVHLDINGRTPTTIVPGFDVKDSVFHEACNKEMYPNNCNAYPFEHHIKVNEVFPLVDMSLHGAMFWGPRMPEQVLAKYYGETWNVPDRYGEGEWVAKDDIHCATVPDLPVVGHSTNEQWANDRPRVYVDVVGDLFHFGHVRLFERAKKLGTTLVVGVHDDATVASYKRTPILTMEERINIISSIKYVDEVVAHAPLVLTAAYLDEHRIDLVVRGDDQLPETSRESYGVAMDRNQFRTVPYTEEISTSDIIRRILNRGDELRGKKETNRLTEVEVGVGEE